MFMLDFLDGIYKQIFAQDLFPLITGAKVLGGLIVFLNLSFKLFKNFSRTGQVLTKNEKGDFNFEEILTSLGILLLIGLSPEILSILDSIFVWVESLVGAGYDKEIYDFFHLAEVPLNPPPADESALMQIARYLMKIYEFLNPVNWLGGAFAYALEFVLNILDLLIYALFLAQRYFIMGLIKLFLPLMIAFSAIDKFRDFTVYALKIYARYFLVIIPYLFATVFVNEFHDGIINMVYQNPVGQAGMTVLGSAIKTMAMLFAIVIKLKLYKSAMPFMEKLIP